MTSPGSTATARASRALAVLGIGLMVAAIAGPVRADSSPTPTASPGSPGSPGSAGGPITVQVKTFSPAVPSPGGTLKLAGQLTNTGSDTLRNVSVQLRVSSSPLNSRSELDSLLHQTSNLPGQVVNGSTHRVASQLDPGSAPVSWSITEPLDQLGLDGFGVYPLAVEVHAAGPDGVRRELGVFTAGLPWTAADSSVQPLRTTVVLPLLQTPQRDADGAFTSDTLAGELDSRGRLRNLLNIGSGLPGITWVTDGDLLEAAAALADGAKRRTSTGVRTQPPDPTAAEWLSSLTAATAKQEVVALPYADPDVVAVRRSATLRSDLVTAQRLGPAVVTSILAHPVTSDLAWPAGGSVDDATLTALARMGDTAALLSDVNTLPTRSLNYTPSALGRIVTGSGPTAVTAVTSVTYDSELSTLFSTPASQVGGITVLTQQLLAQTALIAAERPQQPRSLVLTPPRMWNPDPLAVRSMLSALDGAPWIRPSSISDLRAQAAAQTTTTEQRTTSYPASARAAEIGQAQLSAVQVARTDLSALSALLPAGNSLTGEFERAVLRCESAGWRGSASAGRRFTLSVISTVAATQSKVHILPLGPVTLAAGRGSIPITVANDLPDPVVVMIGLTATPSVRLSLDQPPPVTVDAGRRFSLEVPAKALANGTVIVQAQLFTSHGVPFGAPVTFPVHASAYGEVARVVIELALVALTVAFISGVVRRLRQVRRSRSETMTS